MSSVTIPCVVNTGPRKVSLHGLVRQALGYPRQFESVANRPKTSYLEWTNADLHLDTKLFIVAGGLPLAWLQRLQ
jgi:hypothetical protein